MSLTGWRCCEHCAATRRDIENFKFEFEQLKRCTLFHNLQQNFRDFEIMRAELESAKKEAEKCKNELADFKQRMKHEVSKELDSGGAGSENIMNPCRESELHQMYKHMRTQSWRKAKDRLLEQSASESEVHKSTVRLIQKIVERAVHDVDTQIKRFINNMFSVETPSKRASVQKIIHDIQIYFFNCDDNYYKRLVKDYVSQYYIKHTEIYVDLAAECYKLGTLMALHEPPLIPVWNEEQGQSFSFWPKTTNSQIM